MRSVEEMIEVYRQNGATEGDIADMVVDRLKEQECEVLHVETSEIQTDAW